MNTFFNSCYPIVCAPMNGVSDIRLALAVAESGSVPSLVVANYNSTDQLAIDLTTFRNQFNDTDFIVAVSNSDFLDNTIMSLFLKHRVSHLEVLDTIDVNDPRVIRAIKSLKQHVGTKIILKLLDVTEVNTQLVDAVTIKSEFAAARIGISNMSLQEKITTLQTRYPALQIIASGGLGSATEVKEYLSMGVAAVSAGTIFAVSEESSISYETKLKMVGATFNDIKTVGINCQHSLVFSPSRDTDGNNTQGLKLGIKSPKHGLVFAGRDIDHINSIRSVAEIIRELVVGL